ncbi:MAG: ATP-binding protein [Bacteroidales bacterium]|nr:ATP-binding protein [Bacteroidales bacterium]
MALLPYSEEQILDRLRFENPWWISGQIEDYYASMERRLYYNLFMPLVTQTEVRRAIVMMGPRRVGKTVMLYHTVHGLLENNVDPLKIAFVSIETPIYNTISLEQLFTLCRKGTRQDNPKGWYVFFDEIQYLKDWEVHLKSLVDSYPFTRFVVSGSAAAALRLKSNESGAGRFTDFMLPPLTFNEFLHLKKLDRLITESQINWEGSLSKIYSTNNINELNNNFIDYINYGGYPEVIFSEKIQTNPGRYIRSDIIDKVLLRDLPSLYGIRDVQELNSLFTAIAYNSGGEVRLEELSKNSGVQKNTIKRYIEYFEAAFLIKIIHKISNKPKHFQRATQFKIYLSNPSLRSALFAPLHPNDPFIGNMVETAIFAQWMHREWFTPYYARWPKGEVDMVKIDDKYFHPQWAVEIKWSNQFYEKPGDLKSLIQFLKDNGLKTALVTTIDKEGVKEINGLKLNFVPAAVYAYTVGRNTLIQKQKRIS